jgi:hypothetical protein
MVSPHRVSVSSPSRGCATAAQEATRPSWYDLDESGRDASGRDISCESLHEELVVNEPSADTSLDVSPTSGTNPAHVQSTAQTTASANVTEVPATHQQRAASRNTSPLRSPPTESSGAQEDNASTTSTQRTVGLAATAAAMTDSRTTAPQELSQNKLSSVPHRQRFLDIPLINSIPLFEPTKEKQFTTTFDLLKTKVAKAEGRKPIDHARQLLCAYLDIPNLRISSAAMGQKRPLFDAVNKLHNAKVVYPTWQQLVAFKNDAASAQSISVKMVLHYTQPSLAADAKTSFESVQMNTEISYPSTVCGVVFNIPVKWAAPDLSNYILHHTRNSNTADSIAIERVYDNNGNATTTCKWAALDSAIDTIRSLPGLTSGGMYLNLIWKVTTQSDCCWNCKNFGHRSTRCTSSHVCNRCGNSGHNGRSCRSDPVSCIVCSRHPDRKTNQPAHATSRCLHLQYGVHNFSPPVEVTQPVLAPPQTNAPQRYPTSQWPSLPTTLPVSHNRNSPASYSTSHSTDALLPANLLADLIQRLERMETNQAAHQRDLVTFQQRQNEFNERLFTQLVKVTTASLKNIEQVVQAFNTRTQVNTRDITSAVDKLTNAICLLHPESSPLDQDDEQPIPRRANSNPRGRGRTPRKTVGHTANQRSVGNGITNDVHTTPQTGHSERRSSPQTAIRSMSALSYAPTPPDPEPTPIQPAQSISITSLSSDDTDIQEAQQPERSLSPSGLTHSTDTRGITRLVEMIPSAAAADVAESGASTPGGRDTSDSVARPTMPRPRSLSTRRSVPVTELSREEKQRQFEALRPPATTIVRKQKHPTAPPDE